MAIGLVHPDTGTVTMRGQRLTDGTVRTLRRRMGYVVQEGGLFPHLTAEQNVTLMARQLGWTRDRLARRGPALVGPAPPPPRAPARLPPPPSGRPPPRAGL